MAKKAKRSPTRKSGVVERTPESGTKRRPVGPRGAKGGNPAGTHEAGDHQVQGASHQGSSLGKRNSG